jgi:hypothetical protein
MSRLRNPLQNALCLHTDAFANVTGVAVNLRFEIQEECLSTSQTLYSTNLRSGHHVHNVHFLAVLGVRGGASRLELSSPVFSVGSDLQCAKKGRGLGCM